MGGNRTILPILYRSRRPEQADSRESVKTSHEKFPGVPTLSDSPFHGKRLGLPNPKSCRLQWGSSMRDEYWIMLGAWGVVGVWIAFVIFMNRKLHPQALFFLFMCG